MKKYNTTQLDPDKCFNKHVYHRDIFAHYLRWSHILKEARIGMNILDFGAGTGNLCEVFYRNKYRCKEYLGLEYKESSVENANIRFMNVDWARFKQQDLTVPDLKIIPFDKRGWDMIVCFELIEHVGKNNVEVLLKNIYDNMSSHTKLYLSTPIYDPVVGPANNHIVNGVIGELTYEELEKHLLDTGFKIIKNYGTFASIKDYKHLLDGWKLEMFEALRDYYDVTLLSTMMAPFFPKQSRNCLWVCEI